MEEFKNKLINMIGTINNMEKMFEEEDIEVTFAFEELKEQVADMLRIINKGGK